MTLIHIFEVCGDSHDRCGEAQSVNEALIIMADMVKHSPNQFYARDWSTMRIIARVRAGPLHQHSADVAGRK
jgi:hypothetical protein